jgi:hypothetical protein
MVCNTFASFLQTLLTKSTVAHWYNTDTLTASPSQINFLIFVPLFSFISLAYIELAPRFMKKGNLSPTHTSRYEHRGDGKLTLTASHPYIHFGVELVNMLFYFAGFIALATFLGKLLFCRGSVCAAARADAVFAAFGWLLWTGTSALLALQMFRGNKADGQAKVAMTEAGSKA